MDGWEESRMHKVCEREVLLEEFASFRSAPKLIFDSSKTLFRLAVNGELSLGGSSFLLLGASD